MSRVDNGRYRVPTRGADWLMPIVAEVGPFVVHPSLGCGQGRAGELLAVTHRDTGFALHPGVCTMAEALALAERALPLADWTFTDPAVVKAWPTATRVALLTVLGDYGGDYLQRAAAEAAAATEKA